MTDTREKRRILRRLPPNLATLRRIEEEKRRLFRIAMSRSVPLDRRRAAWQRLVRQRIAEHKRQPGRAVLRLSYGMLEEEALRLALRRLCHGLTTLAQG